MAQQYPLFRTVLVVFPLINFTYLECLSIPVAPSLAEDVITIISADNATLELAIEMLKEWGLYRAAMVYSKTDSKIIMVGVKGSFKKSLLLDWLKSPALSIETLPKNLPEPKLSINKWMFDRKWQNWSTAIYPNLDRDFDLYKYPIRRDLVNIDETLLEALQSIRVERNVTFVSEFQVYLILARIKMQRNLGNNQMKSFITLCFPNSTAVVRWKALRSATILAHLENYEISRIVFTKSVWEQLENLWKMTKRPTLHVKGMQIGTTVLPPI